MRTTLLLLCADIKHQSFRIKSNVLATLFTVII